MRKQNWFTETPQLLPGDKRYYWAHIKTACGPNTCWRAGLVCYQYEYRDGLGDEYEGEPDPRYTKPADPDDLDSGEYLWTGWFEVEQRYGGEYLVPLDGEVVRYAELPRYDPVKLYGFECVRSTDKHFVFGRTYCMDGGDLWEVTSHCSSSVAWLEHDLSKLHTATYDATFGKNNWEFEWVENPNEHPVIKELI